MYNMKEMVNKIGSMQTKKEKKKKIKSCVTTKNNTFQMGTYIYIVSDCKDWLLEQKE